MHGFVYIILKESLKNIPIIGWGCQFYNFIFLARNWEEDQQRFKKHLSQLNNSNNPMWLIIFPEGTNLSETTREKSARWAEKNGLKDMKHQLLPRSTGLRFCLQELKETTEWLYDCTIAYEGVPPGQFGQDIFTLRSSFFEGRPPKSVNMHWRRFRVDSIPIHNSKAFEVWLRNRWREKDYMLEYFTRNNRFPADDFWKQHLETSDSGSSASQSIRSVPKGARTIETEVKSGNWNEFIKIFAPITSIFMALSVAYGATPNDLPIPGSTEMFEKIMKGMLNDGEIKGLPGPEELQKMIEGVAGMSRPAPENSEQKGGTQQLTQENLAKLVKETAVKHGIGQPQNKKPQSTAAPSQKVSIKPVSPPQKPAPPQPTSTQTLHTKSGITIKVPKPAAEQTKAPDSSTTQTVFTKSGIAIKIPKPQVEEAKKSGTIVTKSGLVIKVGRHEIEEAQKKRGETVMTASGVPIKVTPSGGMTVEPKGSSGSQSKSAVSSSQASGSSTVKGVKPAVKGVPKKIPLGQKKYSPGSEASLSKAPRMSGALPIGGGPPKLKQSVKK
jgi:hypothetical protein